MVKAAEAVETIARDYCFFPFLFLAWDFYNTGNLINSVITCVRDFMWPAAVVVA